MRRWLALLLLLLASPAQAWPERPVRFIVSAAAGGSNDTVARVMAEALTAQLPHPVIVENRPGAQGMLGAEVPLATGTSTPAISHARNNFRNASVNLHPRLTLPQRAERIAAELAAQRRRSRHAAMLTSTAASAAVPPNVSMPCWA